MKTIVDYLDQLTYEYSQLCQRSSDGTIYGIAEGKQCRKGKPISANPIQEVNSREASLRSSPKYRETPGSSTKIPRKSEEYYREVAKELVSREPGLARGAQDFISGKSEEVPLSVLYAVQGFNAKPELVATTKDLMKRNDVLKKDNGETILFYRGSSADRTDQLLGVGEMGDVHGAGKGMFGNGTYASATNKGWDGDDKKARDTAISYARSVKDGRNLDEKVATFALRSDANILDFDTDYDFDDWFESVIPKAERATGLTFNDVGQAAAALGIHAYKIPGADSGTIREDYWVILNRGAIIATVEELE